METDSDERVGLGVNDAVEVERDATNMAVLSHSRDE
jgi:hypothetical protein